MKSPALSPLVKACLLACAALSSTALLAQSKQPDSLERVVVTGSHIKRSLTETSQPVTVLGREDIQMTGSMTLSGFLGTLTNNDGSALSELSGANAWASGASGISLRHLGAGGTLVLVNGRRMPSYGFADGLQLNFTNIDAIPANVVERVEVLKDGASAIYGSDAIGGVVNIITRRNITGLALNLAATQNADHSFLNKTRTGSLTGGYGSMDAQGFNVYGHVELYQRDGYKDSDIRPLLPEWYLLQNPTRKDQSTGSFPGNYVGRYPANYSDPALAGKRINQAAPGCAPELLRDGLCWYDYWKDSDALPPSERITALAGGRLKLSNDWTAYAEFQGADIKTDYHTALPRSNVNGVALNWYDSIKGEMQSFVDPQLPVGHASNPFSFPIGLNYRFTDHPDMFKNVGASTQYRLLGGVEGVWGDWDVDAALGLMRSRASQRQHLYRDRYAYYDAIVSGEYKFGQQNPRALLEKMFPEMGSDGEYKQQFVDLRASRELLRLGDKPVMLALGAELRHEEFWHRSMDNILQARIVQFSGVSIDGERDQVSAFGELAVPLGQSLELSAALRGDKDLDGFGAVTPKFSLAWRPVSELLVRGTLTQGFRAPSLPETGNGGASWFNNGYVDPKRCNTAKQMEAILKTGNAGDKVLASTARALGCEVSFPAAVTPNPDLKPEHSNNLSAGFVWQATRELSLAADYYHIKRRDEIGTRDVDRVLADEDRLSGLVQRGALTALDQDIAARIKELSGQTLGFAVGPIKTIGAQYQNQNRSKVSGVDADLRGKWRTVIGQFEAGAELAYLISQHGWDQVGNKYSQNYAGWRGVPRVAAAVRLGFKQDRWSVGARIAHTKGTRLAWGYLDSQNTEEGCEGRDVPAGGCAVPSTTRTTLWAKVDPTKNLSLSLNIFNLWGQKTATQHMPNTALPLDGRVLKLGMEWRL
ncbi:TonB-dependent receptor plug domain-containing protein [Inhella sp.]|uniref:TonB-dependent receptor plug domain-containing protein n=1 Tax=Inhella sp. TaxID=1921806 RepID=UPI0035B0360E